MAVPLKLSAISIEETITCEPQTAKLNEMQIQMFLDELTRIEQNNRGTNELAQLFRQSTENKFLFDILRPRPEFTFQKLRRQYPRLMADALRRSKQSIDLAASQWNIFTTEMYTDRGQPIPDWPQYIEIQEGLGLYGRSRLERVGRKLKRRAQKWLDILWDKISTICKSSSDE